MYWGSVCVCVSVKRNKLAILFNLTQEELEDILSSEKQSSKHSSSNSSMQLYLNSMKSWMMNKVYLILQKYLEDKTVPIPTSSAPYDKHSKYSA